MIHTFVGVPKSFKDMKIIEIYIFSMAIVIACNTRTTIPTTNNLAKERIYISYAPHGLMDNNF